MPSSPGARGSRQSRIAAALEEEIPDDPVARKAYRDRIFARLKEKLSDCGNAGVPTTSSAGIAHAYGEPAGLFRCGILRANPVAAAPVTCRLLPVVPTGLDERHR